MKFCMNMYLGPSQSLQDVCGDRDQRPDPGLDFRIFHCCEIGQKKFVSTITEKVVDGFD